MKNNRLSRTEMRELYMEMEEMKESGRTNSHEIQDRFDSNNNYPSIKADIILCLMDKRATNTLGFFDTTLRQQRLQHLFAALVHNQEQDKILFFSGELIEVHIVMKYILEHLLKWYVPEHLLIRKTGDSLGSQSNINNIPANSYISIFMARTLNKKLNYQMNDLPDRIYSGKEIIQNLLSMSTTGNNNILDLFPTNYYPTVEIADTLHCNTISIIDTKKQREWINKQLTTIKLR